MIIVHHLNNSRSIRILWTLEELEIPYEIKHYTRGSNKLAPKELKEVHPLGKSPVIVDTSRGNKVVAESGAIINYLIKYYGNGRGTATQENEDENDYWVQFSEASFMPTLVMKLVFTIIPTQTPFFLRPLVHLITGQVLQSFIDPDLKTKCCYVGDYLEQKCAGGKSWFAGGDKKGGPTAADFQMLFPLEALTSGRVSAELIPNSVRNWVDMAHSRPAFRRAYEANGPYDYAKL